MHVGHRLPVPNQEGFFFFFGSFGFLMTMMVMSGQALKTLPIRARNEKEEEALRTSDQGKKKRERDMID